MADSHALSVAPANATFGRNGASLGAWVPCDLFCRNKGLYLIERMTAGDEGCAPPRAILSSREGAVAAQFAQGAPLKLIAADLSLSVQAVSTYLGRAKNKLGVRRRAELVRAIHPGERGGVAAPADVVRAGGPAWSARGVVSYLRHRGEEWFRLRVTSLSTGHGVEPLTAAEQEVLLGMFQGLGNREIARDRKTSCRTVDGQVASIIRKTARSRAELLALLCEPCA